MGNIKSNLKWAALFACICALCAGLIALRHYFVAPGGKAVIKQNGEIIRELSLSEDYEITVKSDDGGYNRVRVKDGSIAVVDADCPDRLCVNQGYISSGELPVVCLPHKLSIEVMSNDNEVDSVTGVPMKGGEQ
ncbi:MAG: NusG domain II-containing protein [Oscillospiraceae bacterium]|nr:NusG domain II-containing protein [Oscillospiraceae bacterium]